MSSAMRRVTTRNLMSHKLRLALTALAVVLGVSFVAGTLIFTDTMGKSFDDLFNKIGKNIAVDVRPKKTIGEGERGGNDLPPIPASVVTAVGKVDGVRNVQGQVQGYTGVIGKNGKVVVNQGAPQIGLNWTPGGSYDMKSGRAPAGPDEIALDDQTAKTAGLTVGSTARYVTTGAVRQAQVVGIIDTGNLQGATIAAFDTPTAQKLLLRPGYFNSITMATSGPSETVLRDRVAQTLPGNLEAVTGTKIRDENKSALQGFLSFFRTFLLVFALISIFVGSFIIFNTFSMLVAQRTKELALLRAIGASRKQVTRSVLGEAVVVGFLGSTVGIGLGTGLAALLQAIFTTGSSSPLVFTATPFIWSYAVGITVTVVSAYFPARRAAKIPPVAAMRDDVALPQRSLRIRVAVGSVLAGAGALGMILGIGGATSQPLALLGAGAAGVFLGVTLLAPVISRPVVRVLGGLFPKVFGTPGRLAQQNAMRNPRRTASTAAALMIGLALVTTINVMSATMKSSVDKAVNKGFGADYIVAPDGAGGGFSTDVLQAVQRTPGVKQADPFYSGNVQIDGKRVQYDAADPVAAAQAVRLKLVSGSMELGNDGFLVQEDVAKTHNWTVGSTTAARFPDGKTQQIRVAGIYAKNDFLSGRVLAVPLYRAHTDPSKQLIVVVAVTAAKADTATKHALEGSLRNYPTLQVQDQSDVKKHAESQINGLTSLLTMLLAMSLFIAAIGVVNTLALSVIERTREIGLLRAVGTSRRQLRRIIRLESIVIAVFGAVLGIAIGLGFGVAIQHGLRDKGLDVLSIPVGTLVIYVVLAAVIGVLAALWPAWRAGRMDVLKAISTH